MNLVFQNQDGSISVMTVVGEDTAEVAVTEQAKQPGLANATFLGRVDTLPDKTYRDAWRFNASNIETDMATARDIHMDRIRAERNEELVKSDNELRVAEDDDQVAEVAKVRAKRKMLRDIPQTFDLTKAKTPEELNAMWPAGLPRR